MTDDRSAEISISPINSYITTITGIVDYPASSRALSRSNQQFALQSYATRPKLLAMKIDIDTTTRISASPLCVTLYT